jgi:hypothetical protein
MRFVNQNVCRRRTRRMQEVVNIESWTMSCTPIIVFSPFSYALPENGHNQFLNAGVVGVIEVTRRVESA